MKLSTEDLRVINYALSEREDIMFRDSEKYRQADNQPAMMDCLAEMKKAKELRLRVWHEMQMSKLQDEVSELAEIVREMGEPDDNVRRIWLHDLNDVCDIAGHTDVMCAHYGEDGILTFQVNTGDDSSTIFVYYDELPDIVQKFVSAQIREAN